MATWKETVAQAKKILGDKADIPASLGPQILKANKDIDTTFDKFAKAVTQLEAAMLARQNTESALSSAAKQL